MIVRWHSPSSVAFLSKDIRSFTRLWKNAFACFIRNNQTVSLFHENLISQILIWLGFSLFSERTNEEKRREEKKNNRWNKKLKNKSTLLASSTNRKYSSLRLLFARFCSSFLSSFFSFFSAFLFLLLLLLHFVRLLSKQPSSPLWFESMFMFWPEWLQAKRKTTHRPISPSYLVFLVFLNWQFEQLSVGQAETAERQIITEDLNERERRAGGEKNVSPLTLISLAVNSCVPVFLLINWATPMTTLSRLRIGMQQIEWVR